MKVSVGNSRMDKKWNLVDMSLEDFRARIFSTHKTAETMEQYRKLPKAQRDEIKDMATASGSTAVMHVTSATDFGALRMGGTPTALRQRRRRVHHE